MLCIKYGTQSVGIIGEIKLRLLWGFIFAFPPRYPRCLQIAVLKEDELKAKLTLHLPHNVHPDFWKTTSDVSRNVHNRSVENLRFQWWCATRHSRAQLCRSLQRTTGRAQMIANKNSLNTPLKWHNEIQWHLPDTKTTLSMRRPLVHRGKHHHKTKGKWTVHSKQRLHLMYVHKYKIW